MSQKTDFHTKSTEWNSRKKQIASVQRTSDLLTQAIFSMLSLSTYVISTKTIVFFFYFDMFSIIALLTIIFNEMSHLQPSDAVKFFVSSSSNRFDGCKFNNIIYIGIQWASRCFAFMLFCFMWTMQSGRNW